MMIEKKLSQNVSGSDLDLPFEKLNVSYENEGENSLPAITLKSADYHQHQQHENSTENSTSETNLIQQKRLSNEDYEEIGRAYCTKKKRKQKSILREAKLVLPIQITSPENAKKTLKQKSKSYSTNDLLNESGLCCECHDENVEGPDTTHFSTPNTHRQHQHHQTPASTCSTQYMNHCNGTNEQSCMNQPSSNFNENELASYFEQMLYIPKPMSLMAEMMYA